MPIISASDLYIVVTYVSYDGISGDTENLYTDKAEAEKEAAERTKESGRRSPSLTYSVMDLYDYIQEVRSDARAEGRSQNDSY
jgi:hypothetical protein